MRSAAIVTVGSELVEGLRVDTNTAEVARALTERGFTVTEATSVGDDAGLLASTLRRLCAFCELVVVTGGLGPTHDDITRDAASTALDLPLTEDAEIRSRLSELISRHRDPAVVEQVLTQALVLHGATVLPASTGTAPGQVVSTPAGYLALLPGPPKEMRPMLAAVCGRYPTSRAVPVELGVTGMGESDVQLAAQRALEDHPDIELTVLARPGDVRVLLLDRGAGVDSLRAAGEAVRTQIGEACYTDSGRTLAEEVLLAAAARGLTIATAESCTGGMVGAALTDIAGSSAHYLGGVVSYSNQAKIDLLDVPAGLLARHGAVSEQTAAAMAEGARARLGADVAVAVTGIAGPEGGTDDKPVGLVWFGVATAVGTRSHERRFLSGDRESVRSRATAAALDLVRRALLES